MRSHRAIVGFVSQASEADAYPPLEIAWRTRERRVPLWGEKQAQEVPAK
jgi:hypothetical protein